MKTRILTLAVCLLSFLFTSCDLGGNITIYSDTYIKLYSGETSQIDAESTTDLTYESEDEFVASVSKSGRITGERVGQTTILVMDDWGSKKITVEVKPYYNLYEEPLCDKYLTRSDVINAYGQPTSETDDGLRYESTGKEVSAFLFLFDEYGDFLSSVVVVYDDAEDELDEFIEERYWFYKSYSDAGTTVYGYLDALDRYSADLFVGLSYSSYYCYATYIPNSIVPYYAASKASNEEAEAAILAKIDAAVARLNNE